MGGLTYLIGGLVGLALAALIAVPLALISLAVPVKAGAASSWRAKRAFLTGVVAWFVLTGLSLASMLMRHDETRDARQELAAMGLSGYGLKPLRATTVVHGDTAQTYIMAEADLAAFEAIAADLSRLERAPFDAHRVADRGWPVPAWWPGQNCEYGFELRERTVDASESTAPPVLYNLNWCRVGSRLYVQRFDY